jgi:hypothetical protein
VDIKKTGCRQCKVAHWSSGVTGDFRALAGLESLSQVWQSFCMPGHMKCCGTSLAVALVPGCDRSWTDWNTFTLKFTLFSNSIDPIRPEGHRM